MIAASLRFNDLNADEGYEAFDVDLDGKLSISDMRFAADTLQLEISHNDMQKLFARIDVNHCGYIDREGWSNMIANANHQEALKVRGVLLDDDPAKEVAVQMLGVENTDPIILPESLKDSVDSIAAALSYNNLSIQNGYYAFDVDEDGQLSLDDLRSAVGQLSLNLSVDATLQLFRYLGGEQSGSIGREEWFRVISMGSGDTVLRSLGV
jgi:Ca2+-binding EF-hand superfamily protein